MSVKLSIVGGIVISFIISLFIDGVRSFLLGFPARAIKYYQNKNFKRYKLSFENAREIKGLFGRHFLCSFDGTFFILNVEIFPKASLINPIVSDSLQPPNTIGSLELPPVEGIQRPPMQSKLDLTNKQLVDLLNCFVLYDQAKQTISLSDSLYSTIRIKLNKRKMSLIIVSGNDDFSRIPYGNLSERDFDCAESKLMIESS